jgi:hypothetical protein
MLTSPHLAAPFIASYQKNTWSDPLATMSTPHHSWVSSGEYNLQAQPAWSFLVCPLQVRVVETSPEEMSQCPLQVRVVETSPRNVASIYERVVHYILENCTVSNIQDLPLYAIRGTEPLVIRTTYNIHLLIVGVTVVPNCGIVVLDQSGSQACHCDALASTNSERF